MDIQIGLARVTGTPYFVVVQLQTGKVISNACISCEGKFNLKIEKRTIDFVEDIETDFLLIASGSCQQVGRAFYAPLEQTILIQNDHYTFCVRVTS